MINANAILTKIDGTNKFMVAILILVITVIIQKMVKNFLSKSIKSSSKHLKVDETQFKFFRHFVSFFIFMVGAGFAIYSIPSLRTLSVSLFAGAGVLAVIIGFASQAAFANIVSGIFIVIFKPFKVGDRIKISNDLRGVVEDITLRHTVLKNFENKHIVIPNSVISAETIENSCLEDQKICKFVEFNISLDSNIDKALKIMQDEANKNNLCIDNRNEEDIKKGLPKVRVKVIGFTNSGITLRAWVWTNDPKSAFEIGCDLNKSIKEKFDKEGIEIPFPYRTIVYKKDMK